jgi:hypothetical protein
METPSTDYVAIPKGRGFVYAHNDQLYHQVKKHGEIRYLKCQTVHCDGSAKLQGTNFLLGVSHVVIFNENYDNNFSKRLLGSYHTIKGFSICC